jgi:hypothetical protein
MKKSERMLAVTQKLAARMGAIFVPDARWPSLAASVDRPTPQTASSDQTQGASPGEAK